MGTVPNQLTWTTGVPATAPNLNSNVRDAINFLLSPPLVSVTTTSSLSWASSTNPAIITQWATATTNTDSNWALSPNPSRLTANTPGLYEIWLYIHYGYVTYTATQMAHCGIALNNAAGAWLNNGGANRLAEDTRVLSNNASLGTSIDITIDQFLNAGDYVEAYTAQTSGANATIAAGQFNALFGMRWVGSQ